jgi:hypothetical protein
VHDDDLIVATHGRSFWVLDSLGPLRQASASIAAEDVHLFTPDTAFRTREGHSNPRHYPVGENPPSGAILYYYLKDEPKAPAKLEMLDADGKVIRTYSSAAKKVDEGPDEGERDIPPESIPAKTGMNRFVWDLRYETPKKVPGLIYDAGEPVGPLVLPGKYQARLTVGGKSQTASFEVKIDPRVQTSPADLRKQFDLMLKLSERQDLMNKTVISIRDLRAQLLAFEKRIGTGNEAKSLAAESAALRKKIGAIEEQLVQVNSKSSEDQANYPTMLNSKLAHLQSLVDSADTSPTPAEDAVFTELNQRLETQLTAWREILAKDLPALNESMHKDKIPAIAPAATPSR